MRFVMFCTYGKEMPILDIAIIVKCEILDIVSSWHKSSRYPDIAQYFTFYEMPLRFSRKHLNGLRYANCEQ